MDALRRELNEDAITLLILWATTQEYDATLEVTLQEWSKLLGVEPEAFDKFFGDANSGTLAKPALRGPLNLSAIIPGLAAPDAERAGTPPAAGPTSMDLSGGGEDGEEAAAAAADPWAGGGGKRAYSSEPSDGAGHTSKRARTGPTVNAAVADPSAPVAIGNVGPCIGRKVLRYWPHDSKKNKGDPWFTAVVTDYDADLGVHKLTYSLMKDKEEYEEVSLGAALDPNTIRVTDEYLDLKAMYLDKAKRNKSEALRKSRWLAHAYGDGEIPRSDRRSSGGGGGALGGGAGGGGGGVRKSSGGGSRPSSGGAGYVF